MYCIAIFGYTMDKKSPQAIDEIVNEAYPQTEQLIIVNTFI